MTPNTPRDLTIAEVRLTPVLISDPPLLNVQGVHQPYTPRLVVEIVTADGVSGVGETYGDTRYLDIARPYAELLPGRSIADLNGLAALAQHVGIGGARVDDSVDVGGLRGVQTADKLRLSVFSAFEVACLDALGKVQGLPVHALLGGKVRDAVEYSAYLFYRWAEHPDGAGSPTPGARPWTRRASSRRHGGSWTTTASPPSSSRAASSRRTRRSPR